MICLVTLEIYWCHHSCTTTRLTSWLMMSWISLTIW
jgi:hypothetical protein